MKSQICCPSIVAVLGLPVLTTAISIQPVQAAERNLVVGLGGAYTTTVYHDVDEETVPVPILEYQIGRITLRPVGFDVLLAAFAWPGQSGLKSDSTAAQYSLSFSATADYADDERDNSDSAVFAGMERREEGSTAGVNINLETPIGVVEAAVISDIANISDGRQASIEYGFPLYAVGAFSMNGAVGAAFSDENWNDYYFGVRNSEARPGRAAYTARSSINPYVGISATFALNQHWTLSQSASVTKLDESIVESPLTSDDEILSEFFLGVLYHY